MQNDNKMEHTNHTIQVGTKILVTSYHFFGQIDYYIIESDNHTTPEGFNYFVQEAKAEFIN